MLKGKLLELNITCYYTFLTFCVNYEMACYEISHWPIMKLMVGEIGPLYIAAPHENTCNKNKKI